MNPITPKRLKCQGLYFPVLAHDQLSTAPEYFRSRCFTAHFKYQFLLQLAHNDIVAVIALVMVQASSHPFQFREDHLSTFDENLLLTTLS